MAIVLYLIFIQRDCWRGQDDEPDFKFSVDLDCLPEGRKLAEAVSRQQPLLGDEEHLHNRLLLGPRVAPSTDSGATEVTGRRASNGHLPPGGG